VCLTKQCQAVADFRTTGVRAVCQTSEACTANSSRREAGYIWKEILNEVDSVTRWQSQRRSAHGKLSDHPGSPPRRGQMHSRKAMMADNTRKSKQISWQSAPIPVRHVALVAEEDVPLGPVHVAAAGQRAQDLQQRPACAGGPSHLHWVSCKQACAAACAPDTTSVIVCRIRFLSGLAFPCTCLVTASSSLYFSEPSI